MVLVVGVVVPLMWWLGRVLKFAVVICNRCVMCIDKERVETKAPTCIEQQKIIATDNSRHFGSNFGATPIRDASRDFARVL